MWSTIGLKIQVKKSPASKTGYILESSKSGFLSSKKLDLINLSRPWAVRIMPGGA
jgi:hypothetical protein